jgi:hypothetical protein
MNAGIGGELVEIFEPPDVADLDDESGRLRRPRWFGGKASPLPDSAQVREHRGLDVLIAARPAASGVSRADARRALRSDHKLGPAVPDQVLAVRTPGRGDISPAGF